MIANCMIANYSHLTSTYVLTVVIQVNMGYLAYLVPPWLSFFTSSWREPWEIVLQVSLGQLFNRVDLIKPVSTVCPWICPYVRLSTKRFFDFSEIWLVGRRQWVMHDAMQYDPIQGQGHEPFKVGNLAIFKSYLLRHLQWELATDHGFLN